MGAVANVAVNVDSRGATSGLSRVQGAVTGLVAKLGLAVSATELLRKSISTAFERTAAEQKLRNFTNSTAEYNAALGIAAESAQKFGLSQTEATQALGDVYSRLKGLGFGLKETSEIYQGFNTIAKQSGTSAEDASGAFLQLSQALGSGKLQGDELRSILERMPTLAQRIADSMGRSAAEIRNMGQSGELTSQVIYKALSEAAAASDNLGAKLTSQQKAMASLKQVADGLMNSLGQVFAPAVIAGAQALAAVGQKLNEWYQYLAANVFPKVLDALQPIIFEFKKIWNEVPWDKILGFWQGALIKQFNIAIAVLQRMAPIVAGVMRTLASLAKNPVFKFMAEQAANLAKWMGISSDEVQKFTDETKEAETAAAATVNRFSQLPPPIVDAKEQTKKLVAEIEKGRVAVQAMENDLNFATSALQQQAAAASQLANLQKQLNSLEIKRLETLLAGEKRLDVQLVLIKKIRDLKVKNAEIEYKSTKAQIKLEKELAKIEVSRQYIKLKNLEIDYRIAKAKGQEVGAFVEAYRAGEQAVELAKRNLALVEETADMQMKVAEETFRAAVRAADMEANTAASAARMRALEQAARDTARATNEAADATERMRAATQWKVLGKETDPTKPGYYAERINEKGRRETVRTFTKGAVRMFGEGGYVDKPTNALIGERNEGEYIVPASKVGGFIDNYLSGARGRNAVPEAGDTRAINIQTGPVMQQDGKRYVTLSDMEGALQVLASSLLNNGRTAGGRRYQGV